MKNKPVTDRYQWIWILLVVCSALCVILCVAATINEKKHMLALLPAAYCGVTMYYWRNYRNVTTNFAKLMIHGLCFVRMVLLPTLYSFQSEWQLFEGRNSVSRHISSACMLMVYEYFVIQLTIALYERTRVKRFVRIHWKRVETNIDIGKYLVWCLFWYIILLTAFLPQYTSDFKTIFMLGEKDFTTAFPENAYVVGTIGRILRTLYSLCFQLFRVLFPAYLLKNVYERVPHTKWPTVILVLGCGLQFFFLTSTFAEAIVASVVLILFYIRCYPKRVKKILSVLVLGTVGVLLLFFIVRYYAKNSNGMYHTDKGMLLYAAQIINAYFSGIDNVAAVFNIPSGHQWEAFWADMIGAIPFNSTLIGYRGEKLQFYFNLYNASQGQIPPSIGTGYYYFGLLLSPVFTGVFTHMGLRYYDKAEGEGISLRCAAYYFCSVAFILGTAMYSPAITLQWYFSWGALMLVITHYTRRLEDRA